MRNIYIAFIFCFFCIGTSSFAQSCDEEDEPCPILGGCEEPDDPEEIRVPRVHAVDPNDITGNLGYEDPQWVSVNEQLGYRVRFENDPAFATAPAQAVEITVPLDTSVNILDFRLSDFGFGMFNFQVPPNSSFYSARLDVVDSMGIFVDIAAGVDIVKREAFWKFQSIDLVTGLPPEDAFAGFLPVNDTTVTIYTDTITQQGEGYVSFSIKPISTAMTGDSIHEQASIVFDLNEAIPTNIWKNIIDAFPPESQILPNQANVDTNFVWLEWTAVDDPGGVGVDDYDLFVSKNGEPFYLFQENIDSTTFFFEGEMGATYCFYTLATDFVKNKEAQKEEGDICINLGVRDSIEILSPIFQQEFCNNEQISIAWETVDIPVVNIFFSIDGGNTYSLINNNELTANSPVLFVIPDSVSSDNCLIRIDEVGGNNFIAESDRFIIHPVDVVNIASVSCNPDDVGVFETLLQNQNGCDSTIIETVSYSEVDTISVFQTTCIVTDTSTVIETFQNQYGCDSIVTTITEYEAAELNGVPMGDEICLGDEYQFNLSGAENYTWTPSAVLSDPNIANPIATLTETTTLYVTTSFSGGCELVDTITIIVNEPIQPEITIASDSIISSEAAAYQWYFDGDIISGATNQFYLPSASGNYAVEITDENGCTAISEITFVTVGTTDLDLKKLVIKPNPASDFVIIELETFETLEDFEIELVDMVGKKLMSYRHGTLINQFSTMIHLDQYPAGVYVLLLKSKNRVHFEKIVVAR